MSNKISKRNVVQCLLACTALVLGGMGSQCPGSSSSATFKASDIPGSASASSAKAWKDPMIVDFSASSSFYYGDQNFNVAVGGSTYPMAVFSYGSQKFQMILGYECDTGLNANAVCVGGAMGDGDMYGYIFQPATFASSTWVSGLANYIPFGTLNRSLDYTRTLSAPQAVVDAQGNVTAIGHALTDTGDNFILAQNYSNTNSYWTLVNYTQSQSLFYSATQSFIPSSTNMAIIPTTNQVVVQTCATDNQATHAVYSPYSTWSSLFTDWTDCSIYGSGMGFDNNGRGFLAYTSDTNDTVYVKRWSSGGWAAPSVDISVGSFDIMPTVFVDPTALLGHASIFVYRSGAHLGAATLRRTVCTYAACTTDAADFDNGIGTGNVYTTDGTNFMRPALAVNGAKAAIFFVKPDAAGNRAIWYSVYQGGGSWGSVQSLQDSVSVDHTVNWVSAAINSSGKMAVVYSAYDASAGDDERVFGTIYSGSSWSTATRLDNSSALTQVTSPAEGYYMPSVAIDSDGNAVATFSMEGTGTNCGGLCRQAVAIPYR